MAKKANTIQENTLTPKQTAIWLIDNTTLTFDQIGKFCNLHPAEVQAIADGTVASGMVGESPIMNGELTQEEIERCEKDENEHLTPVKNTLPKPTKRSKGPKYTPISKRGDKPDAIMYMLKNHSEVTDAQITKLIGTTKNTIKAIREKTHANISEMKPRHPADLGLCTYVEFEAVVEKAKAAWAKANPEAAKAKEKEAEEKAKQEAEETEQDDSSGFDFSNFLGDMGTGTDK